MTKTKNQKPKTLCSTNNCNKRNQMKDRSEFQRTFDGPKLVLPTRSADIGETTKPATHTGPKVINADVRTARGQVFGLTTAPAHGGPSRNANTRVNTSASASLSLSLSLSTGPQTAPNTGTRLPAHYPGFHFTPTRVRSKSAIHGDERREKYLGKSPSDPRSRSLDENSPQLRLYQPVKPCPFQPVDKDVHTEIIGSALDQDQKSWSTGGAKFGRSRRYPGISPIVTHLPDINPETSYSQEQFTVQTNVKQTLRKYGPCFQSKIPRTEEQKAHETPASVGPGSYEADVCPMPKYVPTQDWAFSSKVPRSHDPEQIARVHTEPVYYTVEEDAKMRNKPMATFAKNPRFVEKSVEQTPGPGTYVEPWTWGPKQVNTFTTKTNMETTRS